MVTTTVDPMDDPAMAFQSWDYWLKYLDAMIDVGVNIVLASILFTVFYIVVWILIRIVRAMLLNPVWRIKKDVVNIFLQSLKCLVWMQLVPILVSQIGLAVESIIAVITMVMLSVAIPLKLVVENFVSGVMLLWRTPFNVGDVVHLAGGGITGVIQKTSSSFTEVRRPDGCHVFVPNSCVCQQPISNHTQGGRCRVDVVLPLPPRVSAQGLVKARRVMLAALAEERVVLPDPEPVMVVQSLSELRVTIMARVWVLPGDYFTAEAQLLEVLRQAFVVNGIEMAVSLLASRDGAPPLLGDPGE